MTSVLLALLFLLMITSSAAAVETIGFFIIGGLIGAEAAATVFTIGAITVSAATLVGTAAVVAVSIGLQYGLSALAAKPGAGPGATPNSPLPIADQQHTPLKQAIPPRVAAYGRARLAGSYLFYEAHSAISYDVTGWHNGKIQGIVGYYLHDDAIALTSAGFVTTMSDGRYGADKIYIETRDGSASQTAFAGLVSEMAAFDATLWNAAHKGNGLALAYLKCSTTTITTYTTVYPRGLPVLSIVADCSLNYDWRPQTMNINDETTWAVSHNPVIQLVDQLTHPDRGMGFEFDDIIAPSIDDWSNEADICDQNFLLKSGSFEPTYTTNGSFSLDTDPADVIETLLLSCDGFLVESGNGSVKPIVGKYRSPTVTITKANVRGIAPQYGTADEQLVNEFTVTYVEPQADYKTLPGQPWRDEANIATRGLVRSQPLQFKWVYSHSQCRRLAKRRMMRVNSQFRGTLTTDLFGIVAFGERWVGLQYDPISDFANVVIEITSPPQLDLASETVTFQFVVVDPNTIDAWTPATEEGTRPTLPNKLVVLPLPIPQNFDLEPNNGPGTHDGWNLSFDDTVRPELIYQVLIDIGSSNALYTPTWSLVGGRYTSVVPDILHEVFGDIFGFTVGNSYTMSVRSVSGSGGGSAFSNTDTETY